MNNDLTTAQTRKLAAAKTKLPSGYSYIIHELDSGKPYGVTVLHEGKPDGGMGYTYNQNGLIMGQLYTGPCEQMNLVRLALNRAAAALWGKQPTWPADCFYREA